MAEALRPRLADLCPGFAAEIAAALSLDESNADLAAQVSALEVWERCGCKDGFCASVYTGPRPLGAWAAHGDYQCVPVDVETGMVILDVVDRVVRYVEVLDRPDVKRVVETLPMMDSGSS